MSADQTPRVAVVVVTYNRARVLSATLDAVRAQTMSPSGIVVVDNASSDETGALFVSPASDTTYIRCEENLGHSAGMARGLEWAVGAGFDHAWMLDDDTAPHPNALERLWAAMSGSRDAGIVGLSGGVVRRGVIKHIRGNSRPVTRRDVDGLPLVPCDFVLHDGAVLSLDVTRSVGFPRADFFIMLDEVEYCSRIRRAGWRVFLLNECLAKQGHMGSTGPWRGYYQTRNELLMAREQRSLVSLWGWGVRQAKFTAGHLAYSDRKLQRLQYRVRGAWDGFRGVSGRTVDPRAS